MPPMSQAPSFSITAADVRERAVRLRLPFRFGAVTVTSANQAFVRVAVRFPDGRAAIGMGAELIIPKWFDKAPERSHRRNSDDLRAATAAACAAYAGDRAPTTAFGHAARHYAALQRTGEQVGRTALSSAFGSALVDRAVLDALCRALRLPFATALAANLPGIDASLAPDLAGFAIDAFLSELGLPASIAVRHTVGLLDPLTPADAIVATGDDLPVALTDVIARYGCRHFKLKLAGDPAADLVRMRAIARVLDPVPGCVVTLDGNEQYRDPDALASFEQGMREDPRLRRLTAATIYLEQPLPRDVALETAVPPAAGWPRLIDESDDSYDAWPAFPARAAMGSTSRSSMRCVAPGGTPKAPPAATFFRAKT
jgi:hypothetical protein